jgi:hypothetical protein
VDTKEDRPGEAALALYRDLLITPANKAVSGALNRSPSSAFDQMGAQENEGDREAKRNSPCPFRKRHPEINLDYTRFKFPVLAFSGEVGRRLSSI